MTNDDGDGDGDEDDGDDTSNIRRLTTSDAETRMTHAGEWEGSVQICPNIIRLRKIVKRTHRRIYPQDSYKYTQIHMQTPTTNRPNRI